MRRSHLAAALWTIPVVCAAATCLAQSAPARFDSSRASSFANGALTPVTPIAVTALQPRAPAVAAPPHPRRWPWIAGAAVLLAVAAGVIAVMMLR